jgi:hypothetical protein
MTDFTPLERIDSVKFIGPGIYSQIVDVCQCETIDGVCSYLGKAENEVELGRLVQRCCANARGGQTVGSGKKAYKIPHVNYRAAHALLSLLASDRGAQHLQNVRPSRVRAMIKKMESK